MKKLLLLLFMGLSLSGFAQRTEVDTMTNRINYTVNPLNGLNVRGIFRIRTVNDADTVTSAKIQAWDNAVLESASSEAELADSLDAADYFVELTDYQWSSFEYLARLNGFSPSLMVSAAPANNWYNSSNMADQSLRCALFYMPVGDTITSVTFTLGTKGDYTGDNYNGIAVYKISGTTYTLVASTTNNADIWKADINTPTTVNFATPYIATAGWYYIAHLYNQSAQTTAPAISNDGYIGYLYNSTTTYYIAASNAGEATLPATMVKNDLSATGTHIGYIIR